ncbi:putative Mg2+ transporter-C (MgtC) family protein [Tindallia magadiensis]|uniref:Putative Mg2+ transporter-C (MgtC) family protein n=1 Tax=Tindallia magadiensis TaxID=69895 RepID=A0A1I3FE91_9FIRM|nr:MgtC/SapB family protein [Tindallia magadiensis]SFI09525.1 putative Mg2+ transporter-C (MgtC) family protein [Tindallia magadiensis]
MIWVDFTIRLLAALLLGTMIGAERQWRQRMSSLRTNALVSVGAALFVLLSVMVEQEASPTRIAASVVSGIGFLGGGVILRDGLNIRGLNTAATLWCSAGVGVLAGSGYLTAAAIGTFMILLANIGLRFLQRTISREQLNREELELPYRLRIICHEQDEGHIRATLLNLISEGPLVMTALQSEDSEHAGKIEVNADLLASQGQRHVMEKIVSKMSLEESVSLISWKMIPE